MSQFRELLELLYNAHRRMGAMSLEIRDWAATESSDVLVVETNPTGKVRMRWAAGGPRARPAVSTRRVWFERPSRTRVEVLFAESVVRAAVQNGPAWWRWDQDDGEQAGDLTQGVRFPPLLELPLLYPARLLHTMWLEVVGTATRGQREVLKAIGKPREVGEGTTHHLEFEFDIEHGTPLHVATFEGDECINTTEVLSVDYAPAIDPAVFRFERRDGEPPPARGVRRPRRAPEARPLGQPQHVLPRSALTNQTTVWLTGLPGAGKTTIARMIERLLYQLGTPCCVLDGDELRKGLSSDLGLSRNDRREQARRAAHVAATLTDSGVIAIVALVSPDAEDRGRAREIHRTASLGFLEVLVETPVEICAARDVKSSHSAARAAGFLAEGIEVTDGSGLTGLTAPYEAPTNPELRVSGHEQQPRVSATQVIERLLSNPHYPQILVPRVAEHRGGW